MLLQKLSNVTAFHRTLWNNKKAHKLYNLWAFVLLRIISNAYLVPMAGFEPA
ncbi:MAG: hypothetical protein RLZZ66_194 [Pseudomonadota bacterium]